MSCHFNEHEDKNRFVTHVGTDCTSCHAAHGNDDDKLLVRRDAHLCAPCHENAHKVTHPIGEDVLDPRTEETMTCLSCHQDAEILQATAPTSEGGGTEGARAG